MSSGSERGTAPAAAGMQRVPQVPDQMSFPKAEEEVMGLWKDIDAFKTSLKMSEGRPEYTFYDGPPFATGLPHYGHILAGTIKDTVTRYAHQTGHYVSRRFGWDCHGLPVEFEIDKKLGITGTGDVEKMGIDKYNAECRSIVTRYCGEWEAIIGRMGRWIDFKHDYKTMEPWYMESVWWVFKTLWDKDLVYRGFKVMPYSTKCTTPLSNFEANLNYKDVSDPAVVVSFPIVGGDGASFLAWTTTPWTLPSNLALCVHPEIDYVKVRDLKSDRVYVLAKTRLVQLYPKVGKKNYKGGEFEVLEEMKGAALDGTRYEPLFPYFFDALKDTAFRVVSDDYVTDDSGTGIVHSAPAFGEDDYRVCIAHGVISKGGFMPCPVDANGCFSPEVTEFAGMNVKDADPQICTNLKARGRMVQKASVVHSYPFCWRSDTPLIYKAVPSWFVKVESIRDRIVSRNQETYWVPPSVKDKRFHNWLCDARDWAVSRNRYWGTPLPIWTSEDGEEVVVIGSVQELEELSGQKVTDLHREYVDLITIPSKQGKGVLRRVPEVFDCWFESGSMPYAQLHYPFENKDRFENGFPADFIAEGLDQTRGWFYTLMVLSTALFDKPAFKNLVVNGLVLAADGKKMSKRLQNYPDPMTVVSKYGADALRMYLVNSPVVRAEPLRFKEDGVRDVLKGVVLPWYNAYRFFDQSARRFEYKNGRAFVPDTTRARDSTNVLDHWVQAAMQSLIQHVRNEMEQYHLYTVLPHLVRFIESLTNMYVRLNRTRLKAGDEDTETALCVIYDIMVALSRLMAPFTPFFTEYLYQRLRQLHPDCDNVDAAPDAVGRAESVHYTMVPDVDTSRKDEAVERRVDVLRTVLELGRAARDARSISLRKPVISITVVSTDPTVLEDIKSLEGYVRGELNMRDLNVDSDDRKWCTMKLALNMRLLGRRLGRAASAVRKEVGEWSHDAVKSFLEAGSATVQGHEITREEVEVVRESAVDPKHYEAAVSSDNRIMVVVDVRRDDALVGQGLARELVSTVQKLRKDAGLKIEDRVHAFFGLKGSKKAVAFFEDAILANQDYVRGVLGEFAPVELAPLQARPLRQRAVPVAVELEQKETVTLEVMVADPVVYLAPDDVLATVCPRPCLETIRGMLAVHDQARLRAALEGGLSEVTLRVWDSSDAKTAKTVEVKLVKGQHLFTSPSEMASTLKLGKFASLRV